MRNNMAVVLKQYCVEEKKCCPCAPPPSPVAGARRKFCLKKYTSTSFAANQGSEGDIREYLIASLSRMNVGSSTLKRKKRTPELRDCSENMDAVETPNGKKVKTSIFPQRALFPLIKNPLAIDGRQRRELMQLNWWYFVLEKVGELRRTLTLLLSGGWSMKRSRMTWALDWLPMVSRTIPRLAPDTCNFEQFDALSCPNEPFHSCGD